jgi:hypothetical protein
VEVGTFQIKAGSAVVVGAAGVAEGTHCCLQMVEQAILTELMPTLSKNFDLFFIKLSVADGTGKPMKVHFEESDINISFLAGRQSLIV